MARRRRLSELQPRWIERGLDWAGGISFSCPFHCYGRVSLFFVNGLGGFDFNGPTCLWRYGNSMEDLSLNGVIDLRPHFLGQLVDGWLTQVKVN